MEELVASKNSCKRNQVNLTIIPKDPKEEFVHGITIRIIGMLKEQIFYSQLWQETRFGDVGEGEFKKTLLERVRNFQNAIT